MTDAQEIFVARLIGFLLVSPIIYLFIYLSTRLTTESLCLDRGFARFEVTYTLTRYCIKRSQTTEDHVVRLSEIEGL